MLSVEYLTLAIIGAGSGNRTRALSLEGSYDTISPYPLNKLWDSRMSINRQVDTSVIIKNFSKNYLALKRRQ